MSDPKVKLGTMVRPERVLDDSEVLNNYSRDLSFAPTMKPQLVVKPANVDEVQKLVGWANLTHTPLVPVSSGPPHSHGDTVPGVPSAVILDFSDMKKIISIDRRNRIAIIEPGVTYAEIQPALAKAGLRFSLPLLPRANKSVIASLLEREPRLNCRYQWSSMDPLRCLEIIWGDGNKLWSGSAGNDVPDLEKQRKAEKKQVDPSGPGQTDFYRFLSAAQGSMGIATWASVKCEVLPLIHKLFIVPGETIEKLTDFTYKLLRFRYADEVFLMNKANLAYALSDNPEQIQALKDVLPSWAVIVGIAGRAELPEERVEFQEKDIREIARRFNLELLSSLPRAVSPDLLKKFISPSKEPYWKTGYKGAYQDIFFITTLDRTPGFVKTMYSMAASLNYPSSDIGIYLQPRHQGANCHCEFNLPYSPDLTPEISRIQNLHIKASKALSDQGAFFSRPYGEWADLAFNRDLQTTDLLKKIKGLFDPNGIMNPGKLCFKSKAAEVR